MLEPEPDKSQRASHPVPPTQGQPGFAGPPWATVRCGHIGRRTVRGSQSALCILLTAPSHSGFRFCPPALILSSFTNCPLHPWPPRQWAGLFHITELHSDYLITTYFTSRWTFLFFFF